ncbi:MAG: Holliday junction resolvase RuvX [Gemmatimonadota bacterium]|jgi:putative Holliday junction resolvase
MTVDERVLAIDYGERRVGMAVSDPTYGYVRGLPTIDRRELTASLFEAIADVVGEEEIDRIVIGIPYTLEGTEGKAARQVRSFAGDLASQIDIPIDEWDERLTSEAARRALREAGHDERAIRTKVDQLSAVLMLEGYLRLRARQEEGPE